MWSSKQQQQKIFLKHIRSKSPFAAMEILFLSFNINQHDTNASPLNFLSIVTSDSFLSGLKMVSSTNLRVVILTQINTLPLFILFRMIVDTKCSFVRCYPYIVFFSILFLNGLSGSGKWLKHVWLKLPGQVGSKGPHWLERVWTLSDQTLQLHPLITGNIKQSKHHLTWAEALLWLCKPCLH